MILRFLWLGMVLWFMGWNPVTADESLDSRIRGLLVGSLIGDALGGPVEFQEADAVAALPNPPKRWLSGEKLNDDQHRAALDRLWLRPYTGLRPEPGSYAHWTPNAAPGTVTDDSRHKMVLIHALRKKTGKNGRSLDRKDLARAYLEWPTMPVVRDRESYRSLCDDWLKEWRRASRWVIGERNPALALPPERMWSGLPTCCGQMTLPPLAALYPGKPEQAYVHAYELSFFDNGFGKDMNAALAAGLAAALALEVPKAGEDSWKPVIDAMKKTDPYRYGEVPWAGRVLDRWLDEALCMAANANGSPAELFEELEKRFVDTIKWQAEVPFVVVFALLAMCPEHPLTALQLSVEWGHDTDSYAALCGAFVGARYGEAVFPERLREPVENRLKEDYDESVSNWVDILNDE